MLRSILMRAAIFAGFVFALCALIYVNARWIVGNSAAALPEVMIMGAAGIILIGIWIVATYMKLRK